MARLRKKDKESMSIRENYAKGELAKEILKGLAVGGLIVASLALPNLPQVFSFFGIKSSRDRFRMKRAINSLEKQKFIEIYEKGGDEIMEITERGEKRVLKFKFAEIKITRPKKWDREWRIIAFDIPERHKRARSAITMKLKEIGVYPLQKSVFICPFECKDEIDFISEVLNVRKYIHYFIARKLDEKNENYLKRYYNV